MWNKTNFASLVHSGPVPLWLGLNNLEKFQFFLSKLQQVHPPYV